MLHHFISGTYRSRSRRGSEHVAMDIAEIEKKLILEMGDKVCVYEDVCVEYAEKVKNDKNYVLDWQDIFRYLNFYFFCFCLKINGFKILVLK